MRTTMPSVLLVGAFLVVAPQVARAQWIPYPHPAYPYPLIYDDVRGAVRIQVDQREAEVYVDGYYAGIVDDFDGTFQRLRVPPGGHQIVIRLEGFHSVREDLYVLPDVVRRIRRTLQPLAAGEPEDPRPVPAMPGDPGDPAGYPPVGGPMPPGAGRPPTGRTPRSPQPWPAREPSTYGSLVIRIQPADAEIFIDGEQWRGPEGDARLVVQLSEGRHRVEVRKTGFASFSSEIQVDRGETVPLNVSLSKE